MSDHHETSTPVLWGLVGITVLMLVLGWIWTTEELPSLTSSSDSSACASTRVAAGEVVRPSSVVVSVFNAGQKPHRANGALKRLEARGFAPGDTGNTNAEVKRVEVWGDPLNPAVQLVARQFGANTPIVPDGRRLGDGVVVVVGDSLGQKWGDRVHGVESTQDAYICSPKA